MTVSPESTSPSPDWDLVRLAEVAPEAFSERVASEVARADRDYTPVGDDLISKPVRLVQEGKYNRARLVRFSDYLVPGESVVEIGCGGGFVAAQLLRAGAGSYRAMDLEPICIRRTTRLLTDLGLDDRVTSVVEQDLYTLTPPDLAGASLVVCSEVIEHVPDPEGALLTIARALPEGADLLMTMPVLGRLETVWGHLSIFTVERLQGMLARAGLAAHHVEPLGDRWTFVLAGHRAAPATDERLDRVRAGARDLAPVVRPEELPIRPPQPTRMCNVDTDSLTPGPVTHTRSTRVETHAADSPEGMVSVRLSSRRSLIKRPTSGGVALPLPGGDPVMGVRVELGFASLEHVTDISITFRGPGSTTAGVWTWQPGTKDRKKTGTRRFTIRPGSDPAPFSGPRSADLSDADRVEVSAALPSGGATSFTVRRVGWIH